MTKMMPTHANSLWPMASKLKKLFLVNIIIYMNVICVKKIQVFLYQYQNNKKAVHSFQMLSSGSSNSPI